MQFESDETNDANKNKNSSDAEREWALGNLLAKTAKAPMTFLLYFTFLLYSSNDPAFPQNRKA